MDSRTALRGPNASAGPFARSITAIVRPRVCSTQPFSLASSSGQYRLQCNQSTKSYPSNSQAGLGHEYPRNPDHRRMYVQQRSPKVAEHPAPGLPDYEHLSRSHQSGDQNCYDRVARSALPQSPRVYVLVPAVLSGSEMNMDSDNNSRLHSLASPLSSGVRVGVFGAGNC